MRQIVNEPNEINGIKVVQNPQEIEEKLKNGERE